MKKTIKRLLFGLLAVLIIVIAAFGLMFGKEIQTIASIKKVDDYGGCIQSNTKLITVWTNWWNPAELPAILN